MKLFKFKQALEDSKQFTMLTSDRRLYTITVWKNRFDSNNQRKVSVRYNGKASEFWNPNKNLELMRDIPNDIKSIVFELQKQI